MIAVFAASVFLPGWLCAAETSKPNVVFILADDQSYRDFGFMGNEVVSTPNLDRLARQSARYPNGYVPMSVCRPSLATLLTGLYPHQHGIHFNHPPPGLIEMRKMTAEQYRQTRASADYLIQEVPTLPRILAAHGYACLQTGKHWEGNYRIAGFTHGMTLGLPSIQKDLALGTRQQKNGEWVAHGNGDAGLKIGRDTMQPIERFLEEHAGKRPFFIWYAPFLPHTPFDAPPRFRKLYETRNVPAYLLPYYAEIARFDETVGQLLKMLKNRKLLKKTLIVFVSDNGFRPDVKSRTRQNKRSKLTEYEDGLRTPILIRWDGYAQPAQHNQLVQTVDLMPTVLAAVGLSDEMTPRMKGVNLLPSVRGDVQLQDRPAFGSIYPNDAQVFGKPSLHVRGKWVRDGDYKLIAPGLNNSTIELSLFNLRLDPEEKNNLATGINAKKNADRILQMQRLLDQWWPEGDDSAVTKHSEANRNSSK